MAARSRAAIIAVSFLAACATPDPPVEGYASGHYFRHTRSPLGVFWSAGAVLPGDPMVDRPPAGFTIAIPSSRGASLRPDRPVTTPASSDDLISTIRASLETGFPTCVNDPAPPMAVTLIPIEADAGFSYSDRGFHRGDEPWRLALAFRENSDQLIARIARTTAHETFHRWAVGRPAFRSVSTIEEEVAAYVVGYCVAVVTTGELPIEAHPPSLLAFGPEGSPGDRAPFSDETLKRLSRAYRSGERFDPPTTAAIYLGLAETLLADLTAGGPSGIREALPALARQIAGDPASLWDVVDALAADGIDAPDAADAP